jgi:hypothetical protein
MTAAQRMQRLRKRRRAEGLKPVVSWVPEISAQVVYSSHRLAEARSLAMHCVIARKIEKDQTLLLIAEKNIDRWTGQRVGSKPAWLREWQRLLRLPWQQIAALVTEPSENGARLRQSSPFAGILTNAERWRIYEAFRT